MTLDAEIREFYSRPAQMTAPGRGDAFENLPRDLEGLCNLVQNLLLHEHFAPAYGETLSAERRAESQIRPVAEMLARISARDDAPLTKPRPPGSRLVGVCRHFAVSMTAMLRAQGVAARARCGFATYFTRGRFEDHWVVEYRRDDGRWVLADAQIDEVQKNILQPDFDLLDVPRDRFILAGDAWRQWRTGREDGAKFGIFDIRGAWFIAGNLLRDFAALNNMEMLPWDMWGPMARDDAELDRALFDRLAALTLDPDHRFAEIRALYGSSEPLRVPPVVFNAILGRPEPV